MNAVDAVGHCPPLPAESQHHPARSHAIRQGHRCAPWKMRTAWTAWRLAAAITLGEVPFCPTPPSTAYGALSG